MSTRCTLHFEQNGQKAAIVYRHCDGYPESDVGVLADFDRFLSDVEAQTNDTRFTDPCYLAAKFVVWQANQNAKTYGRNPETGEYEYTPAGMLDFLSLGVVLHDPGDIEYRYHVKCNGSGENGRPVVAWEKAGLGMLDA